jgi:hypothetical protein
MRLGISRQHRDVMAWFLSKSKDDVTFWELRFKRQWLSVSLKVLRLLVPQN